ncbi:hypothetical protein At12D1_32670 [Agrobacterium tumefaciens]|nr:hypothetical protein At12D1_32670 [Agrobacterium tumefaciens]
MTGIAFGLRGPIPCVALLFGIFTARSKCLLTVVARFVF